MSKGIPKIASLQAHIKAAQQEFDMAVMFHEVWKPSAFDVELHKRLGVSYATNAFHIVRVALRREMLLALMRLWDKPRGAVRMEAIAKLFSDASFINALATERASGIGLPEAVDEMRDCLMQQVQEVVAIVDKYSQGGTHYATRDRLKTLRDEFLAHRQIEPTAFTGADTTDEDIESFFQDNSQLIRLLLSVAVATAYDPNDTASVYNHYAKYFWDGVCGERTNGHPNYRPSPFDLQIK